MWTPGTSPAGAGRPGALFRLLNTLDSCYRRHPLHSLYLSRGSCCGFPPALSS